jgi:hypothetical protein
VFAPTADPLEFWCIGLKSQMFTVVVSEKFEQLFSFKMGTTCCMCASKGSKADSVEGERLPSPPAAAAQRLLRAASVLWERCRPDWGALVRERGGGVEASGPRRKIPWS